MIWKKLRDVLTRRIPLPQRIQIHNASDAWDGVLRPSTFALQGWWVGLKPRGGFWTAPAASSGLLGFLMGRPDWIRRNWTYGGLLKGNTVLTYRVVNKPRILHLRNYKDVQNAWRTMMKDNPRVRDKQWVVEGDVPSQRPYYVAFWKAAMRHYDGIHVIPETKDLLNEHGRKIYSGLESWDVESTVWFSPDQHLRLEKKEDLYGVVTTSPVRAFLRGLVPRKPAVLGR